MGEESLSWNERVADKEFMATLPHQSDHGAILQRLDQLGMLADHTGLVAALSEYASSLDEQLLAIVEALDCGARDVVARAAHRIAGGSSTLGAKRLCARAAELERRAGAEPLPRIVELAAALLDEARSVRAYVGALIADPPNPATIRRGR